MTPPVAQSLELLQRELAARLSGINAWSSPAPGFCAHMLRLARLESIWPVSPAKWSAPAVSHDEAPGLATLGYYLAHYGGLADAKLLDTWKDGFARLRERDPLPRDRQTFLHRPIELLGIILGARIAAESTDWIRDALLKKPAQPNAESFLNVVSAYAAHLVGTNGTLGTSIAGELSVEAHALLVVLLREGAVPIPSHLQPPKLVELQDALLLRLIELGTMPVDEPRLAAVITALSVSRSDRLSAELQAAGQINPSQRDALILLHKISRNFEAFARQINKRHNKRPGFSFADEYDVQDAFHAILRLHFEDVREEEYGPSVAGKHGRMDFLLQQYRIGVETKMTRKGLGRAELIGELAEDTIRFRKHPELEHLFCFVYDPQKFCDNPAAVESDLSTTRNHPQVSVVVSSR